jgi:hypothetical protein
MSAIKRELERLADVLLTSDYETIRTELKKLEELGGNLELMAQIIDTAKAMAPECECGNDYFEGIAE